MAVTLKQIAERTGLSWPAVSLIMNNKGRIAPETRQRVLRVAAELGYRPNRSARAIRDGRFGCVALVLSSEPFHSHLPQPMLSGIQQELAANDLQLTLLRLPDEKLTSAEFMASVLRQWSVDGLLLDYIAGVPPRMAKLIEKHRLPAVWLNTRQRFNCVRPDDLAGGRLATEHLLALGHTRIAYVDYNFGSEGTKALHYSTTDRAAGYEQAMDDAGQSPRIIRAPDALSSEERLPFTLKWLGEAKNRPTAVVAYARETANPILYAATSRFGLHIPHDLSIVTFHNAPVDDVGINITTMVLPEVDMGRAAVRMLLQRIISPDRDLATEVLPLSLLPGATTASIP